MPNGADVQHMFDRIAGRYDLMNRVMTMGIDRRWRRAVVDAVDPGPETRVLDACCGTGDITFALARRGPRRVVGLDFSPMMLARARDRIADVPEHVSRSIEFIEGDVLEIPFEDDSFDAVTVGFGVRNVERLAGAFDEFVRVVRPGGRVVCLEITTPDGRASAAFHGMWFQRVVPRIGGVVGGDREAYTYLPESTRNFPKPPELAEVMTTAGLTNVQWRTFAGGIVAMHVGAVPRPGPDQAWA